MIDSLIVLNLVGVLYLENPYFFYLKAINREILIVF